MYTIHPPPLPSCTWDVLTHSFVGGGKTVLLVLSLIGFVFFDMVYVSAVMNYAAQSEMNISLLRAITQLVEAKEYNEIDNAIKVE